ncbi:MAG: hypothetical protein JNK31_00205, partial [Candidatus Competibacter sp.]|nr:hypothetical protein [Candidatus Competibacter sp.]
FTATQLELEFCRYGRRKINHALIGRIILAGLIAGVVFFWAHGWGITLTVFALLTLFAVWRTQREKTVLPLAKARRLLQRYRRTHPIAALADGQAFLQQAPAENLESAHYAPERILVVERDDLVDMLVRNRFHASHKTAVISCSGYPKRVVEACQDFLRRHPDTPVQLLHDASLKGFKLKTQLEADTQWPLAGRPLVDLGLSPELARNSAKLPWLPAKGWRNKGALSARHQQMLNAGYRMPVDFLGPKPLLNLLGAAVIGGALLLPAPSAAGDGGGTEIGVEIDVEIDDFG